MAKILLYSGLIFTLFILVLGVVATFFESEKALRLVNRIIDVLWAAMFFCSFSFEYFLDWLCRIVKKLPGEIMRLFQFLYSRSMRWWLRSQKYALPSGEMLREAFGDLKVSSYIAKVPAYVVSECKDFAIFNLGIRLYDGLEDQMERIRNDAERVFKEACVIYLGRSPAIYVKSIRKFDITVWISMDRYGDFLLEEERRLDDRKQAPAREDPSMDVLNNKLPVLGYDLEAWELEGMVIANTVDIRKYPGMLISGPSGSGKSVFTTVFLSELVSKYRDEIESIYYLDFKSASESKYLHDSGYSHYFGGDACAAGLEEFYHKFHAMKDSGCGNDPHQKLNILVFDEAAAFFLSEQTKGKDGKALAEKHLNMMTTIGLQGRSFRAGLWLIFQQPSSDVVKTALRESLHTKVTFLSGGFSPEMKRMIGLDDDTAQQIKDHGAYGAGAAVVLRQGKKAVINQVPHVYDIKVYQDKVLEGLMNQIH